jgi:hypothetical protein
MTELLTVYLEHAVRRKEAQDAAQRVSIDTNGGGKA